MREKKRIGLIFVMVLLAMFTVGATSVYVKASEDKKVPRVGPVKLHPHPASLEGKTVLLRWNGKYNGDRFLIRIGELMTQQVKDVKIIKMWEVDKSTVAISKNAEVSEQVAVSFAKLKPDLVIAAQAD
jgi:predicted transcriptional regulator with HTH domain